MPSPDMIALSRRPGFRDAALFRPDSVALIADPALGITGLLARNLAAGGFRGRLMAVGLEGAGFETAPDIAGLPAAPDLAVLCLPPERQEAAMAALAARGGFAAVLPGAAPDLAGISARTGVQALGQGSFGIAVPAIGLNATLSHLPPRPGRLALVTQSAALARAVLDWAEAEAVGFSHVIGIGGNAGIGFALTLDWLARDAATGAILLDLRRIKNRRLFISAARAAARTRPVLALRAGGRLDDASGLSDQIMQAALRRAGVLRVAGLEAMLSAAETLARVRLSTRVGADATGDRIAIVTNGTGLGQLAADAVIAGGGRLAQFPPEAIAALAMSLPPGSSGRNPISLGPLAGTHLGEAAAMLGALPGVDAVIALHAPVPDEKPETVRETLVAAARASRGAPVLVGWAGEATGRVQRAALAEAGVAVFPTPEAVVRGALHLAADRAARAAAAELPPADVLDLAPDRAAVRRLVAALRAEGRRAMREDEALSVLAAYGLPTVPHRAAMGPEEAAAAAAMLGFPVVLKARCDDLPRKTEVGGVVLGLTTPEAVRRAAQAMETRIATRHPDIRRMGFLVQRQAARAQELRLRLGDDAMFGPWIGFGRGGTAADIDPDEGFDLPPLNLPLATALIARTRTARLLGGYRDHPAADRLAIADALVRLSQIAVDFPEVATLSVNPLVADAEGVLALDATLTLRPEGQRSHLAIPPYPAALAEDWVALDGSRLLIRPIRPEDATALGEFFRALAPEDVRFRFFSALKELPPAMTARLTQIDYDREMAFCAVRREAGRHDRILGVARLIREPGGESGEFSVVVVPAMKGKGVASALMQRILDWGRDQGMRHAAGQILADNRPMLAFMRTLGFAIHRLPEDDSVVEARMNLV
ncbi:MAG TPA: GNAT family N-acetyltransferase [Roseomonas sp.]|jgi:acetyltransferase